MNFVQRFSSGPFYNAAQFEFSRISASAIYEYAVLSDTTDRNGKDDVSIDIVLNLFKSYVS